MKAVRKYTDTFSASLAKGMLENHGIRAWVLNGHINFVSMTNTDLLSVELAVADEDYSEACRLLAAASSAE